MCLPPVTSSDVLRNRQVGETILKVWLQNDIFTTMVFNNGILKLYNII